MVHRQQTDLDEIFRSTVLPTFLAPVERRDFLRNSHDTHEYIADCNSFAWSLRKMDVGRIRFSFWATKFVKMPEKLPKTELQTRKTGAKISQFSLFL